MGVRLNMLADPSVRLRLDAAEMGVGGRAEVANPPAAEPRADAPFLRFDGQNVAPGGGAVQAPVAEPVRVAQNAPVANAPGQAPPAVETRGAPEPTAETDSNEVPGGMPRLRDFRFFAAAESLRERNLETRLDRLARQLEATDARLRFNDSMAVRIDAQLDRARLETDLDMIESQISRLRLERVFARSSAGPTEAFEAPPVAAERVPGLNLLA